ncbi:MAG: SWEET family sugar transporter [bacterium]|nr:SWEET family sugar transporter [bacterium]
MNESNNKIGKLEEITVKITEGMGSPTSIMVHTFLFVGIFGLLFFGFELDQIMLILTTVVSLEAIYLSLFIQMTVNRNTASLKEVEEDIEEIQEDVEDIQEDVGEIEGDVDKIQDHVEEMGDDIEEIQEDVEGIEGDVDKIHTVSSSGSETTSQQSSDVVLADIHDQLIKITAELEQLKKSSK